MNHSSALESFIQYAEIKSLIDRLLIIQEQKKISVLALLSEQDEAGKTFVAATLALAHTSRIKKKVLVIDTSSPRPMNKPVPVSSVKSHQSLLTQLLEDSTLIDVISLRDWENADANVDEYRLKSLIEKVRGQYSLILVDTSSLSRKNKNNFDPVVIARQCDAAILISAAAEVPQDISNENRKRLQDSSINLVGMIHNQGKGEHV